MSDLEPKSACFSRTELEQNNRNLNKASEASENSKSKLSHFTFYKHSKSTEKSAMVASELMENETPKENYFDFAAFEEMDTSEESSSIENNNNNASPIKKYIKYACVLYFICLPYINMSLYKSICFYILIMYFVFYNIVCYVYII